MVDPRLNSIHLDPPRREEYRRAREALLNARGIQTIAGERIEAPEAEEGGATHVQDPARKPPPDLKFWLMDKEGIYPLKIGLNTIGRALDNDVVVKDGCISRRHCAIVVHANDVCELYDTASKNGTYLNGQKLTGPTQLSSGVEIRICDQQLVFMTRDTDGAKANPSGTLLE